MNNDTDTPRHTMRSDTYLMMCAVVLVGCAGPNDGREKDHHITDSGRVAEVTVRNGSVQQMVGLSYEEQQGALLYNRYCAVCHGQEGRGDGFNSFSLDPRPRDLSDSIYMAALSDAQIEQTISGGGRSINKTQLMPAYGWTLSRREIQGLSSYVKTFATPSRTKKE